MSVFNPCDYHVMFTQLIIPEQFKKKNLLMTIREAEVKWSEVRDNSCSMYGESEI